MGLGLLDEALAVGQHQHDGRPIAPGGAVGNVAHQVAALERGIHAEHLGTGRSGQLVALADAAVHQLSVIGPSGQVLHHHLAVVGKTAGGQHRGGGLDIGYLTGGGILEAAADHSALGVLDQSRGAQTAADVGAQLLQLGRNGLQDVRTTGTDAVGRQDHGTEQTGQLLFRTRLLIFRAEVVDGGIHETGVGVGLALHPLAEPLVLVPAGGQLLGAGLPVLVDGHGVAGLLLQLGAVGEHKAAGRGGVATDLSLLLGDDDLLARQRRSHGSAQTRVTGADDENVGFLGEVHRRIAHQRCLAGLGKRLVVGATRRTAAHECRAGAGHDARSTADLQKITT